MSGAYDQATLEAKFAAITKRLDYIEQHLVNVSQSGARIGYTPTWSTVPDEVLELARSGDRLGAVKKYRELTGASFEQARDVLAAL